jgi:hypothetical protein
MMACSLGGCGGAPGAGDARASVKEKTSPKDWEDVAYCIGDYEDFGTDPVACSIISPGIGVGAGVGAGVGKTFHCEQPCRAWCDPPEPQTYEQCFNDCIDMCNFPPPE